MDPLVTVIIPTYNREHYLHKAIQSIQSQTLTAWKLLILDDGSTDGTVHALHSYLGDRRISYIHFETNQGLGRLLQFGLDRVDTPYFMTLDSDDWVEPQTLEVLLEAKESQPPTTSLVCGHALYWQELENGELVYLREERNPSFTDKLEFLFYGPTPTPRFYRTRTVRSIGGFRHDDPSGGRKAEDRYLLLRLIAVSQFHSVGLPLYNVRVHTNNMTVPSTRQEFNEVKRFIYYKVLEEWGGELLPVFDYSEDGWLDVVAVRKKSELAGSGENAEAPGRDALPS